MLYKLYDEEWEGALIKSKATIKQMQKFIEDHKIESEKTCYPYSVDSLIDHMDNLWYKAEVIIPIALYF